MGNSDRITREYFDSLLLETRYINAELASTKVTIFGCEFETPIMTAALSHLNTIHENGMAELAVGAKNAGALFWCGMGEDQELEQILQTGTKTVKIIKPHADNQEIFRKIRHAAEHGVFAVGMDIDHAFSGDGGYDCVLGLPMRPKSIEELCCFAEYAHERKLPFVVKGVLSVNDAKACLKAGVDAILVSHHHGILDYSVPPLMILPDILAVTGGRIPVFIDCGIESGMDAYKALALGAAAVGVGRDLMKPLAEGHQAVTNRIRQMTGQLASVMSRTGVRELSQMDPTVLHRKA